MLKAIEKKEVVIKLWVAGKIYLEGVIFIPRETRTLYLGCLLKTVNINIR